MNANLESQLKELPIDPGIYKYFNSDNEIIYVGKAVNLKNRVKSYFVGKGISPKTKALVDEIHHLEYIVVRSEMDALILEANLIKQFQPRYNIILKDDKSHLYIKITLYEQLPRVSTCRATDINTDPKATYFGPFPSSGTVKSTLRLLRRIFPYVAHHQPNVPGRRRPPQSYFYYNLPLESGNQETDVRQYRHQIFQLVRFLEGKRQTVAEELEKEMKVAARKLDFEQASVIKRQLDGLSYITQKTISPTDYIANPELIAEKRAAGLKELSLALSPYWPTLEQDDQSEPPLKRIECYDISNISGQYAVGSMVVFENGEPLKSDYRRFRIKRENVPNDVAMMEEVLRRRLKRLMVTQNDAKSIKDGSFQTYPNLILVDGGKGQLSVVLSLIVEFGLSIPIAGLTKREEELVVPTTETTITTSNQQISDGPKTVKSQKPNRSGAHASIARNDQDSSIQIQSEARFTTIRLPRGSESLFIIQRIRDEAHRFAITYHRKVRSKAFLPSPRK